jgi:hypothetical protein
MLNWSGRKRRSESLLNMSSSSFSSQAEAVMFYQFLVQRGPRSLRSDVTVELRSLFWNSVRSRNVASWHLLSSYLLVLKERKNPIPLTLPMSLDLDVLR